MMTCSCSYQLQFIARVDERIIADALTEAGMEWKVGRLKPIDFAAFAARLKPGPFKESSISAGCEVVP